MIAKRVVWSNRPREHIWTLRFDAGSDVLPEITVGKTIERPFLRGGHAAGYRLVAEVVAFVDSFRAKALSFPSKASGQPAYVFPIRKAPLTADK